MDEYEENEGPTPSVDVTEENGKRRFRLVGAPIEIEEVETVVRRRMAQPGESISERQARAAGLYTVPGEGTEE